MKIASRLAAQSKATRAEAGMLSAIIFDVSQVGANFRCTFDLDEGTEIMMTLPQFCDKRAHIEARDGDLYTCRFAVPLRVSDTQHFEPGPMMIRTAVVEDEGYGPHFGTLVKNARHAVASLFYKPRPALSPV